jgi:hypothetical protein
MENLQKSRSNDISFEAALRVLFMRGFKKRLSDAEWIDYVKIFKFSGIPFDDFVTIAKKSPGYEAQGIFKAWNSIESDGNTPSVVPIISIAREIDKDLYLTMKKTLDSGKKNEDTPERKADKIAWLLRGYKLTYNTLRDAIFVNGEMLNDTIFAGIHYHMMNAGISSQEAIRSVMTATAAMNPYNPIVTYIETVKQHYDGSPQLEHLCSFFEDEDGLFPLYLRKWLIGAVRKILFREQNPMFVMMGSQGVGKGYFVRWLCPVDDVFVSSIILPDNKDHMIRACERWIWEVVELGSTTRRADMEALKAFLTQDVFSLRRPYGHYDVDKPVTASFIGTINDDGAGFLSDSTGNRRYRPVTITRIRHEYATAIDRDQLWGQIMMLVEQGETADLGADDKHDLQIHVLPRYRRVNILEDYINELFERSDYITASTEILRVLNDAGYKGKTDRGDMMDVAAVMKELGYEKGVTSDSGKRGYFVQIKGENRQSGENGNIF